MVKDISEVKDCKQGLKIRIWPLEPKTAPNFQNFGPSLELFCGCLELFISEVLVAGFLSGAKNGSRQLTSLVLSGALCRLSGALAPELQTIFKA